MTTSPSEPNLVNASQPAEPSDPLSKLHKMSTTAGVASQQYVAVNTTAVVAALLGVASALAMLSPMLLVIPAAGLIVSLFAWRQIGNSNGTETGKPLALVGLALSLLLGGGVAAREVMDAARARADARAMELVVGRLSSAIKTNNLAEAYQLFAVPFRERVSPEQFRARLEMMQQPEAYGTLQSMAWNGVLPIYEKIEGGEGIAAFITVIMRFEKYENRFTFLFRGAGEGWQILNLPEIFPMERPTK